MATATADPLRVLSDLPDAGLAGGVRRRLGKDRIRLWGGTFDVPRSFVDGTTAWMIRHGRYERPEAALALRHFDRTVPVLELGGGLGIVACVLNSHLADPQQHIVVEMDPQAHAAIERNRQLNGARFRLLHAAVDYGQGDGMSRTGRLFDAGNRVVADGTARRDGMPQRVRAGDLVREAGWPWVNLFMDIEGMEVHLLREERRLLRDHVACIVLEFHPDLHPVGAAASIDGLAGLGFKPVEWRGQTMAWTNPRAGRRGA